MHKEGEPLFILYDNDSMVDGYPPTVNAYPECVAHVSGAAAKVRRRVDLNHM
jgi:hypothetical protein